MQHVIDYVLDPANNVDGAIGYDMGRITRGGAETYVALKKQLADHGKLLVDTMGVIGNEYINTLEQYGFKYEWSEFSPTFTNELIQAETAKTEVRNILTRLIGRSIHYTQLGYALRGSPIGLVNKQVETKHGLRFIRVPDPVAFSWIQRMFDLRAENHLTDEEIVQEVNAMGFKSKIMRKWAKNPYGKKETIQGHSGGIPLDVKMMKRLIQNPQYAGVMVEKWTYGKPIINAGGLAGFVPIDVWNKANRGKFTIVDNNGAVTIYKGRPPSWQLKKNKNNPNFPYKNYVLCHLCHTPLLGSFNTGRFRVKYPGYHCARGHERFRIPGNEFNQLVENFVSQVEFTDQFKEEFKQVVLEEWYKRRLQAGQDSVTLESRLIQIKDLMNMTVEKIMQTNSLTVVKMLEQKVEELQAERDLIVSQRNKKEKEEIDIEMVIRYVQYYMDNFGELVLKCDDPLKRGVLFSLIFDGLPTVKDLINGTAQLSLLFKINAQFKTGNSNLVDNTSLQEK